jgi:cytosine/uracil/thiamine/allantoin permease
MTQIDSYLAGELFLKQTPGIPVLGSHRSPLVQLRNQLRWPDQRRTLRDATLSGCLGLVTRPWTHTNSSLHILTSSRVRTSTYRLLP